MNGLQMYLYNPHSEFLERLAVRGLTGALVHRHLKKKKREKEEAARAALEQVKTAVSKEWVYTRAYLAGRSRAIRYGTDVSKWPRQGSGGALGRIMEETGKEHPHLRYAQMGMLRGSRFEDPDPALFREPPMSPTAKGVLAAGLAGAVGYGGYRWYKNRKKKREEPQGPAVKLAHWLDDNATDFAKHIKDQQQQYPKLRINGRLLGQAYDQLDRSAIPKPGAVVRNVAQGALLKKLARALTGQVKTADRWADQGARAAALDASFRNTAPSPLSNPTSSVRDRIRNTSFRTMDLHDQMRQANDASLPLVQGHFISPYAGAPARAAAQEMMGRVRQPGQVIGYARPQMGILDHIRTLFGKRIS